MILNQRICITGGTGFIGSILVASLVEHNEIVVLDNLSRDALSGSPQAEHKNLTVQVGDVRNRTDVKKAFNGADYIIHCAGIAGIDTVCVHPTKTLEVNMLGSYHALDVARNVRNLKRIVCFSTSEVFGRMAFSSNENDQTVIGAAGEARWTYAVSKLAEEHMAMAYYKEFGLPTTVVRPFNVYGPGQVGEGAMKIFVERALRHEPICIHGDGTQIRAWCYVDDMVEGVIRCLENDAAIGESFNIGNARSVQTIYGLANTVIRVLGSHSSIQFAPALSADIELRIPCVSKAWNLLGFKAVVDLEEGIRRTAAFYKNNRRHEGYSC